MTNKVSENGRLLFIFLLDILLIISLASKSSEKNFLSNKNY